MTRRRARLSLVGVPLSPHHCPSSEVMFAKCALQIESSRWREVRTCSQERNDPSSQCFRRIFITAHYLWLIFSYEQGNARLLSPLKICCLFMSWSRKEVKSAGSARLATMSLSQEKWFSFQLTQPSGLLGP